MNCLFRAAPSYIGDVEILQAATHCKGNHTACKVGYIFPRLFIKKGIK